MAIQISGTTVIDNSRNIKNISALYDTNNSVGTASSILVSTGSGIQWKSSSSAVSTGLLSLNGYFSVGL